MMPKPCVTYSFYRGHFGGQLSETDFLANLPLAEAHTVWVTWPREPRGHVEADAWMRAVCACVDVFAEYGIGSVGGFEIGDYKVTNYENRGTTGTELATEAVQRELCGTHLLFSGVR